MGGLGTSGGWMNHDRIETGGMAECMGEAALIFDNGNAESLCQSMEALVFDSHLRDQLRNAAPQRLAVFNPRDLTVKYIAEFERIIKRT
jgi:hypothetical protein